MSIFDGRPFVLIFELDVDLQNFFLCPNARTADFSFGFPTSFHRPPEKRMRSNSSFLKLFNGISFLFSSDIDVILDRHIYIGMAS